MSLSQDDVPEISQRLLVKVHAAEQGFCALQEITCEGVPQLLPTRNWPPLEKQRLYDEQRQKNGSPLDDSAIYRLGEESTPEQVRLWADRNLLLICYFAIRSEYTLAETYDSLLTFVRRESPEFDLSLKAFLCFIERVCDFLAPSESSLMHEVEMLLPECLQPKHSARDRTKQFLDATDRRIAVAKAEGGTPAQIAKMFGLARSTVRMRFQRIEDRGGFPKCFFDIRNPFVAPFSRELFEICKKHKHQMSALQANEIMKEIDEQARKVKLEHLINKRLIRKAIPTRKRSLVTNAPSDAKDSIRDALQTELVNRVVRKKALLDRLVRGLQSSGLRYPVPEKKTAATGLGQNAKGVNTDLRSMDFGSFRRDWPALKMAIRVSKTLDRACLPMKLKSNVQWIVSCMAGKHDYVAMIHAPVAVYANAIEIESRLYRRIFGCSPTSEANEEVAQDADATGEITYAPTSWGDDKPGRYRSPEEVRLYRYLCFSNATNLLIQNAAVKRLLGSGSRFPQMQCHVD